MAGRGGAGSGGRGARIAVASAVLALGLAGTVASAQSPPGPVTAGPNAGTVDEGPVTRVNSPLELKRLLEREPAYRGRILIPANARWTMTDPCGGRDEFGGCVDTSLIGLPVREGVKLVGERGYLNSRPVLRWPRKLEGAAFVVGATDARIEGLHLVGPKPTRDHAKREPFFTAIYVDQDARAPRRITIADNEIEQWSGGGVRVAGTYYTLKPEEWDPAQPHLDQRHVGLVRIERNYLHDNAMDGGGYGVKVSGGGWATIEGNVFDTNRHAVEGFGAAYSGYAARFNYVLEGGVKQGCCWNQHFDMHGTANSGYGGYAGEWMEIAYNTIRGEQEHAGGFKTRPALMLRGRTAQGASFLGNVAVHDDLDEAVALKWERGDTGIGESHSRHNFRAGGNRFDVDYTTEIAAGDFDADGRTDVFLATGTAWFFSRAGIRPWEFLRPSNKRTGELAFADVDNDRRTDVLYRDGAGNLGYVKSGLGDLRPLTTVPVALRDVRFGDFDGDGLTDLFYTRGGQWHVWYGRTRTWTPTQSSSKRISELLFGQFDAGGTTDVAAVLGNGWSISRSSTQPWARINGKPTTSFDDAVAADFDGNGRTDVAIQDGDVWRISRDGRAPLTVLRAADRFHAPRLKRVALGRFDGGTKVTAVTYDLERGGGGVPRTGTRLVMWRGFGTTGGLVTRSQQNMR